VTQEDLQEEARTLAFLNDHKYRLLTLMQCLQCRRFQDLPILIKDLETYGVPTRLFRVDELRQDLNVLTQLYNRTESNYDESFQQVLMNKAIYIEKRYREAISLAETYI
jgi:hypothetical protein